MKLSEAAHLLADAGIENARSEARAIFSEIGDIPTSRMIGCDPVCNKTEVYEALERRKKREPLQYIIGEVDFFRERYKVSPACLIPRQDTEVLVELAVKLIPDGESFIDLCTGSGCIAISTLKNTKNTRAVAVDLSREALDLAKENAVRNGVSDRIEFIEADVLDARIDREYLAVLSNPPYVTAEAYSALEPEIYFEPKMAFVGGGDDGAEFYERIISLYKSSLKPGGFIAFEIGFDQAEPIKKIADAHGMSCEIIKDLSANNRVALLR